MADAARRNSRGSNYRPLGDPASMQKRQTSLEVLMGIRAEQKEKRRQEILDAALDLFIHKGFSATSVRDIAGVIHASPALLFHYFESKDDILMELLTIAMSGVNAATGMLDDKVPPLARFENIARMIFDSFTDYPQSAPFFLLMHQITVFDSI